VEQGGTVWGIVEVVWGKSEGKKLKKQSAQGKSIHICMQGMRKAPCKEEQE